MRPSLIRSAVAIVDRTWGRPRQTVEHLGQPEVVGQGHRNARRSRAMRSRVGLGAKVLDLASPGAVREGCQNSDSRFEEVWQRCDLAAGSGRFASALPVRSRLGSLVRLFGPRARAITRNR